MNRYQLLVVVSPQLAGLSVGGAVGYPSVLLHQLNANDSSIILGLETTTWMGSIHGLAGIPSILMPAIMQCKGRKFSFIMSCLFLIIGWLFAYFATNAVGLFIGESFHGLGGNSLMSVSLLSISEMIAPKFRNVSMVSYSLLQSLGMGLVNILSRYLHWKTVSLVMNAPIVIALLMGCLWPESPSWLACKGEFEKCQRNFIWLRGTGNDAEKELNTLISAQKEILHTSKSKAGVIESLKKFCQTVTSRDFYLPSFDMFVLLTMMYWSGVMVILIYAIQIIEKATGNADVAFISGIMINSILFVGVTIATVLIKYFSNKSVLLFSTLGVTICLFCSCVVTYLQSIDILSQESLLCFYCLIAYMIVASLGLSFVVFTVAAELMPVKHRGIGGALYVIYTCVLHSSSLKIAPYLFLYIGLCGAFFIYMLNAIACGLYVWKYVPETKNRTLQEIEEYYRYGFVRADKDDSVMIPISAN